MSADPHPRDEWRGAAALAELLWTRGCGISGASLAAPRLESLVAEARERSPFYRRLYARLPKSGWAAADLPPVTKARLMASFDLACTDRAVTRAAVQAFLADRTRVGEPFLGRYRAWKSSGTSGTPGLFVQDAQALAVYQALVAAQVATPGAAASACWRAAASGARAALVIANGDHFAAITSWRSMRGALPGGLARSFSVLEPLPALCRALDEFAPAFLASYPSVLVMLAAERKAGRLAIAPALLWAGGETLTPRMRRFIEAGMGCPLLNEYGASECLSIAYECGHGWMHLNDEWVMLEGVDARGGAVPPGVASHTVLVTNLANRVQPIIRYDLGDRMLVAPAPCACGNPRLAFRVEGRGDATLGLRTRSGRVVRLAPLALATVVESAAGDRRFQLAQAGPRALRLHLARGAGAAAAGRRIVAALRDYLAAQSLDGVAVTVDTAAPRIDARSGKLHAVVARRAVRG